MKMFNKILVPLDGSEHSKMALKTAINVAKKFDGEITLLNVYSISFAASLPIYNKESDVVTAEQISSVIEAIRKTRTGILAEGKKMVEAGGFPVKTLLKEGHVMQEIINTAREEKFDLIVMGAKGVSKIELMLLGSLTEKVVRNAPCTVMVVR